MTRLDDWLKLATRQLSKDSAAQVRAEIHAHYESAREGAMIGGATADEAADRAVSALGDAKTANCQYRAVLLTSAEATMLRQGNCEARAFCARPWLMKLLWAISAAALLAAFALFLTDSTKLARVLLIAGLGMSLTFAAPFLPVYTAPRARAFRIVKWVVLIGTLVLILGPGALKWSWLMMIGLWPMASVELTRASIRRKLRVADWPKQLYL